MSREKYLRSKIPLPLVLLYILNVFLVMALELLIFYPHPAELTEDTLAGLGSDYENCRLVTVADTASLHCNLVKLESGDYALIPIRSHRIFSGKGRILSDQIAIVPADAKEQEITVKTGIHSSLVAVTDSPKEGYEADPATYERYVYILYYNMENSRTAATLYMLLAAVLAAIELALWQLVNPQ